ncbi:ABC transporter ATP-binding protein [Brachybacterium horti]
MTSAKSVGIRATIDQLRTVMGIVPWRMRGSLIGLLVTSLISALLDLVAVALMLPLTQMLMSPAAVPGVVQRFVVPVVGTDDRQALLLSVTLIVGIAFVTKNLGLIGIRWWSLGVVNRALAVAQAAMLERYLRSDYEGFRRRSRSGMLQAITSAVPQAFSGVLLGGILIITDALAIVAIFLTLLVMAPLASVLAILVFGGTALLVARVFKPFAYKYGLQGLALEQDAWAHLNPAIEGFRETRIFRREPLFLERYRVNREAYARTSQRQGILGESPKYLLEIAMIVGILLIALLLFGIYDEGTAFGLLAVFAAGAVRIVPALNRVVATTNSLRSAMPNLAFAAKEIEELESEPGRLDLSLEEGRHPPVPDESIVVAGLGFRYATGSRDVLADVDVTIERGTTVALVGSSGAGKSTFADLLTGLLRPSAGTITVGGMDIAEEPRRWMSEVAVVSQRVYLWDAPIRDLITFGEPTSEVDEAHLADVVRRARLEEFVAEQPEGLGQWVGDGGVRVSGGQAQRIGIARALYARPRVLILDEATSALDNETEHQITETIAALHGELTVIVIAHRLSTVKNADEILFFSEGHLAGRGTMTDLHRQVPEFARLVELGRLEVGE